MAAFDIEIDGALTDADQWFLEYLANSSQRLEAQVLLNMLNEVKGRLTSAQATGKLGLGETTLLSYLVNKIANFLVCVGHTRTLYTADGILKVLFGLVQASITIEI